MSPPPAPSYPPPFPWPSSTLPFWRTELHELDSARTTPELPKETDVLIIGAGYSGASTAYHLCDDNPSPPSIVILEARQACSGATGRNGGHLKPDVYFNIRKYSEKYGAQEAAEVARFEASQIFAVKALVEKEKIDCDFVLTRAIDVTFDPELAKKSKDDYDFLVKAGVASLDDVQYTSGKNAEGAYLKVSGVKGALCAFSFTAGHVWPYKLIMALLSIVVAKGVNLQTHTPVTSISDTPDSEGRWTVTTSRGSIKAKKVVLASNAYTSGIAPQFANKIVPVRGICSRITTPANKPAPTLVNTMSLRYKANQYDYLIPRTDGSIIVGGAKQQFWSDPTHWYGVTDDSKLIEPAKNYFDGLMQRHYKGWEDSGAYTDKVWTGIMGYSSDFMPYVGDVPGKPGQLVAAGFSGHGMPLILLSTKGIAQMILHGKKFEEVGIPSIFKATQERLSSQTNDILSLAAPETPPIMPAVSKL
ncbi:Gamma-glutamylputrescine oxidoreductase [Lachnellula hyalina]|uniref:Gamma-glutamylputrescine oxidoreductase n=1 Tax=Lachnellula hyalina TaxID=1316788 RepID=A0A8H8U1N8_9HELO|nr:Gamma-glutamylputrescine oxidoreductase [Lachnellula hyalina]TVY30611.1 Gamma-glutamylputrescine oxidoreductase [Lachnellula hyalina]